MNVLSTTLFYVLVVAMLIATILLLLAPGEIVGLVAGWARRDSHLPPSLPYYLDAVGRLPGEPRRYLVYLDGIGKTAPRDTRVARELVRHLPDALPGTRFVGHITPYSPLNRALAAHPRLGSWWRLALRRFRTLAFLRNVAQTLVASDRRYQHAYHEAIAGTVIEHLLASGYRKGSGIPVVLLGYSGGAEVAVGIAPWIADALSTPPITVVSIGGIIDARSIMPGVAHLHHFRSRNDWVERLGALVFPARWPIFARSGWNMSRRAGRISIHRLDGARHFGRKGYLSAEPILAGDVQTGVQTGVRTGDSASAGTSDSQLQRTLRAVAGVLEPDLTTGRDVIPLAGPPT